MNICEGVVVCMEEEEIFRFMTVLGDIRTSIYQKILPLMAPLQERESDRKLSFLVSHITRKCT